MLKLGQWMHLKPSLPAVSFKLFFFSVNNPFRAAFWRNEGVYYLALGLYSLFESELFNRGIEKVTMI